MQRIIVPLFVLFSFVASAQIGGKRIDTAYHCRDGRIIHPGDTIYLESGTLPDGDFKYIQNLRNVDPEPLSSDNSGFHFTVQYFRIMGNKNSGYKTYAYIRLNTFAYAAIDIEQAIRAKEIRF